jgi:tetratricopeptide (TPR) repeat protein
MPGAGAPKALFTEAIGLIQAGRLDDAETRCRAALARHPGDVNMRALLGALFIKMDRRDEAEVLLREVLAAAPSFAKPAEDLGYLLLQSGRAPEAVPVLERATRLDPSLERAWFSLGKALAAVGRGKESDAAYERSFALSPERQLMALAAEHQREGRLEEAERLYRRVLRGNPRQVDALRLLALIAARADRADDAEALLQKALEIAPDFMLAMLDLARIYRDQERLAEALELLDRALVLEPAQFQAHFLRAATLARASFTPEAIDAYRRSLALQPKHRGALLGLGHVLKAMGDYDGAVASYAACIREAPDQGETYWSLANLKTYRFDDATVADMEERSARQGDDLQSEVNFLFALGKAWEDRGDYDRAWEFYRRGNARQRSAVAYDPVQTEVMNDRLVATYSAGFLEEHRNSGDPDPSPVFIVGLPRSGSTLLEQILASHAEVEGTSELPYVGRLATSLNRNRADGVNYPEAMRELGAGHLAALGAEYLQLARMHRRTPAPRFIDKMPNNFPNIGFIAAILPNAKIIDARRHPLDACLSCYRQLFAKGQNFTYDLTEIGEYYLQYQQMMDHWARVLPGRVLTVQYEEVVRSFEPQVRRLLDFCGLPWDAACLRFHESERAVRTPSSEQVRQPIYDRSIGHWRHYERHLGELLAVIAPIRDRYRRYEPGWAAACAGGVARPGIAPGGT